MANLGLFWLIFVIGGLGQATGNSVIGTNCETPPDILGFQAVLETCEPEFDYFGDQMCFLPSSSCVETCLGRCEKDFNLLEPCEYRFRCSWNFVELTTNVPTVSTELTTEPIFTEPISTEPFFVKPMAELSTEPTTNTFTQFPESSTEIDTTTKIDDYVYDYYLNFEISEWPVTEQSNLPCIFDEQNCHDTKIASNEPISTKPNSSEPIPTKDSSNIGLIIGITGGCLVVLMMISLFGWFLKRRFENQKDSRIEILPTSIVNENYSPKLVTIVNENNEFQCQFV